MSSKNKEQLKECTINLMTLRLRQCLLNLICDLCDHTTGEKGYSEPKAISEIKLEFFKLAKGLADEIDKGLGDRDDYTDSLEALKEAITAKAAPFIGFSKCIELTGEYVSNRYKLNHIEKITAAQGSASIDIHLVAHDCMNYLSSFDDEDALYFNKAEILSCFPHLMPRGEFNEYVKKALKIFYRDTSSEFISKNNAVFKSILAPFKQADISEDFPLLYSGLKEIWDMDLKEKTDEELEELLSTVDDTQSAFDEIFSDYNMLFNDINFLYAIGKYCTDETQLFNDDFELKDLYYSACELTESETAEAFSDTIRKQAEDKLEPLIEAIDKELKKLEKTAAKLANDDLTESDGETQIFMGLMAAVTKLYLDELSSEISGVSSIFGNDEPASSEEADAFSEEITEFISELYNVYTPSKFKLIKQIFTAAIPCPYNNDEFFNYIHNTLEAINGKANLLLAVDNVGRIFEQNGYLEGDEHTHEHGCSCGHHHHHDHNHDCSHSHHHH